MVSHIVLVKSELIILAILARIRSNLVAAVSVVQLIVLWVHGVHGAVVIVNVAGELKDEPVNPWSTPPLEELLVLAMKTFALAMLGVAAKIVFCLTGILGSHALPLAVVAPNIVVVMLTCQLNFALS